MICVLVLVSCALPSLAKVNGDSPRYSNTWVVNIEKGEEVAQMVAKNLGFNYLGQIGPFEGYYKFSRDDHPEVSLRSSDHLTRGLQNLDEVKSARQQMLRKNVLKGYSLVEEDEMESQLLAFLRRQAKKLRCNNIFSCITFPSKFWNFIQTLDEGDVSKLGTFQTGQVTTLNPSLVWGTTSNIGLLSRKLSAYAIEFSDPLWRKQWYEHDYRTTLGPVMDHNVVPVYKMGFTGDGVTVAIVDTGVAADHTDLKRSVVASLGYDVCHDKPGGEPTGEGVWRDGHGTSCAGVVAMEPNNDKCGVGIAYDAKIASIVNSCPEGKSSEDVNAKALVHNLEHIDIYSNSWGPDDNPTHVYSLDELTESAYTTGILKGRKGKGAIYVHAGGNGGNKGDNCATDTFINRPEVIAVGGVTQWGMKSEFSERCTAIFTVAYTGSRFLHRNRVEGVVAPDVFIKDGCMTRFTGTSAATPLVSGIIALTLQSNPELTYRDVMHLIAWTSEVAPLANNKNSWYKNGRGIFVSNDFGFGLINAENMVRLADKNTWVSVPKKRVCTLNIKLKTPRKMTRFQPARVRFTTDACEDTPVEAVRYLEHIELASVVTFPYRGDLSVELESPSKTRSILLERRRKDSDPDGLEGWFIMSVHNWGEDPRGEWTIEVNINPWTYSMSYGYAKEFTLKLHGTYDQPAHYDSPRTYAAFRLPDGQTNT